MSLIQTPNTQNGCVEQDGCAEEGRLFRGVPAGDCGEEGRRHSQPAPRVREDARVLPRRRQEVRPRILWRVIGGW